MNHEDLSALVDDEVDAATCGELFDRLGADDDARRSWARYHLIGAALRDGATARQQPAISAAVVPLAPPPRRRFGAPLAGLAIAASVAALAVVLVSGTRDDITTPGFDVASTAAPAPATLAPQTVEALGEPAEHGLIPSGAYDQRLNGYLVNFNEQRARLGVPGVHPYVRIVGFEAQ